MRRQPLTGPSARLAYALGVGLVAVPLLGIPVRFAYQGIPAELTYGGALLVGVVGGWLLAPRKPGADNG